MTPPRVGGLGGNVPFTPLVKMSLKTMRPSDETVPRYPLNLPHLLPFPQKYPCSSRPPPPHHQAGYHPSRLPKDPAPVATPCVSPPLGQSWPPAQTIVLGPRTSLPTKTYFPNAPSLVQHLRAVHMLSLLAHVPSPRSSRTADSSPITPPKLLLHKGPNCLYVAKTSGHFSHLSYLDTHWQAAPLTGSCFLQQSPCVLPRDPTLLAPPSPVLAPPPSPDLWVVPPTPAMC